jgi:hypothetical protein
MAVPWMKVLDTVGTVVQLSGRFRREPQADAAAAPGTGGPMALEARLAGVVVAALQEAFDRDRARMDLERSQVEGEQRRAAEMLAAELRRQAAERALGQLRLISIIAVAVWMISAILAAWLPGMREGIPRILIGGGWALAFAALGCAFAGWQGISEWTGAAGSAPAATPPRSGAAVSAPWLLLASLSLVGAGLLTAL